MNDPIPSEVIEVTGTSPGSTSIIFAGVHGNETCGVEAINQILPTLKIDAGKVFIAYANPEAIKQKVRFTEANLNRMFVPEELISEKEKTSYEFNRAQYLKTWLEQSDALLDIHASNNPKSQPFIICEQNSKQITDHLPIKTVVYGFDKVEPGGTDYYMNSIGKNGVCLECGYIGDEKSTQIAIESIYSFLKIQGHISSEPAAKAKQEFIQINSLYKSKTDNFRLAQPYEDFENLKLGQIIGYDGDEEIKNIEGEIILFAKNTNKKEEEVFLLGLKIS